MKKTLLDTSNLILNNLGILSDAETVKEIVKVLPDTTVEFHKEVYLEVIAFHGRIGKFPDYSHLLVTFGTLVSKTEEAPPPLDTVFDFIERCKEEAIQIKASAALAKGDTATASKILASHSPKIVRPEFTIDHALPAYDEMLTRPAGVECGVSKIDEYVKGFCYGNMTVIGAPPGSFKTTLAISTAYKAVFKDGFNFAFVSFELMERDMWFNFISRHSSELDWENRIIAEKMKKGTLTPEERERMDWVIENWKANCKGKLKIVTPADFGVISAPAMDAYWTKVDEEMGGLDGIIIDYIQLFRYLRPPRTDVNEFLNDMVRYYTNLSITFRKPRGLMLFILSQINREGEKLLLKRKYADKTSFAEINSLERDAHNAIVLMADVNAKSMGNVNVQVVKNRSGKEMDKMEAVFVDPSVYLVGGRKVDDAYRADATPVRGEPSAALFEP